MLGLTLDILRSEGISSRVEPTTFRWSLSASESAPKTIQFGVGASSTFPFTIYWGEGTETVVTGAGQKQISYSGPVGSFEIRFSAGARVALTEIGNIDDVASLSNIIVGDGSFEYYEKLFSVTNLPASISTTLNNTFGFGRIPANNSLPTNIGSWDVSGVTSFDKTFYQNPAVDDSFGQWTFGNSATVGPFTFNLMSNADISSCLVQWEANSNQGSAITLSETWSDDPGGGSRNPRQLSETEYPLGKAAYDNLISNYSWSDSGSIIWIITYNPNPATSGFLFDYPNAAAAYSVRQLNNNATYAMRVKKTVPPYDELNIGFTPAGGLDESAISTFGGTDPLTVSAWYDQTGNQNHAEQITPGSQPSIYDGAAVLTENGKAILSGGLLQYLTITYTDSVHSTFYVCRFDANAISASPSLLGTGQYQPINRGLKHFRQGLDGLEQMLMAAAAINRHK